MKQVLKVAWCPAQRLSQPLQTKLSKVLKSKRNWPSQQGTHCDLIETHLSIDLLKVAVPVREGCDLCGAHKREVQRVEEKHHVFALQEEAVEECAYSALLVASPTAMRCMP